MFRLRVRLGLNGAYWRRRLQALLGLLVALVLTLRHAGGLLSAACRAGNPALSWACTLLEGAPGATKVAAAAATVSLLLPELSALAPVEQAELAEQRALHNLLGMLFIGGLCQILRPDVKHT